MVTVGFIGGGRAANILLGGWKRADTLPENIVVCDPNEQALLALKKRYPFIVTSPDNSQAARQSMVVLAVHPPQFQAVASESAFGITENAVLLSLMPKVIHSRLSEQLKGHRLIARMIPNAPSIVCAGYNPVSFAPDFPAAKQAEVLRLLSPLGECPVVEESLLEAYAILTGMGPTYFWPQLYALEELGVSFGLSPEAAREGLSKTLAGCLEAMSQSGLDASSVMDLIPAKPMGEAIQTLIDGYATKLKDLHLKLRL